MKFSFIRFFREELAWLAAHDRPYYMLFTSMLRSGFVNVDAMVGDRLNVHIHEYAKKIGYEVTEEAFLDAMASENREYVQLRYYDVDGDEFYLVLSDKARQLLPQYIPELAR